MWHRAEFFACQRNFELVGGEVSVACMWKAWIDLCFWGDLNAVAGESCGRLVWEGVGGLQQNQQYQQGVSNSTNSTDSTKGS